jgi:hypothetical protein
MVEWQKLIRLSTIVGIEASRVIVREPDAVFGEFSLAILIFLLIINNFLKTIVTNLMSLLFFWFYYFEYSKLRNIFKIKL